MEKPEKKKITSKVNKYSDLISSAQITQNGAMTLPCSGDPAVDLFKLARGADVNKQIVVMRETWKRSPEELLKILFYTRDCRGGKGEKDLFRTGCGWLMKYHPDSLLDNMSNIPYYGNYKDWLEIFLGTPLENNVIQVITVQLKKDYNLLRTDDAGDISLCAKYVPSESTHYDREHNLVSKLCFSLGFIRSRSGKNGDISSFITVPDKQRYRKFIKELRDHLRIVESYMCSQMWGSINYSSIPAVANKNYLKAFMKHDGARRKAFLEALKQPDSKVKMNVGVLHPHEMSAKYLNIKGFSYKLSNSPDDSIEAMWSEFIKKKIGSMPPDRKPMLAICDISGSMYDGVHKGLAPIYVSTIMSVLIAMSNIGNLNRKWMSFSEIPKINTLTDDTLFGALNQIMSDDNMGYNTNLQAVFDTLLGHATLFNVPQKDMPGTLVIISDMQFDQACVDNNKTNFQVIDDKYKAAGYQRPNIVFWNVNGDSDSPVRHDEHNTALIGGFSIDLLNLILDGKVPNPREIMEKAIKNPRYDRVVVPNAYKLDID